MIWWKNVFRLIKIWESFLKLLRMRVSGKSIKFKIGDKIMNADYLHNTVLIALLNSSIQAQQ